MATILRSNLHVEGINDVHVIKHLLLRHGINCPIKGDTRSAPNYPPNVPEITPAGNQDAVLNAMMTAVPVSNGRSVGFVLDADAVPQDLWRAVCGRLRQFGLVLPNEIPSEGFVDDITAFQARVGVWLMPDNQQSGAMEQFLRGLVDEQDSLLPIAERSTANAKSGGASFPDSKESKAVLHTWLAWQENPGLPYGSAVKAKYFRDDSTAALTFVTWYGRVFGGRG